MRDCGFAAKVTLRGVVAFLLLGAFAGQPEYSVAQEIATDSLPEVRVTASRYVVDDIRQPILLHRINPRFIENSASRDLTELLFFHGLAHVRSYGPGMAGGLTQRGFGASSFQVIRNGFPLNNAMLGQADLSIIPLGNITAVQKAPGNASSAYGSSAAAGSLLLEQYSASGMMFSAETGSLGRREYRGYIGNQHQRFTWNAAGGFRTADNDFKYYNRLWEEWETRENNHVEQRWFSGGFRTSFRKTALKITGDWSQTGRQVPNSIVSGRGKALQDDEDLRFTMNLFPLRAKKAWNARFQAYQNVMKYSDVSLRERSYNRIRGVAGVAEMNLVENSLIRADIAAGLEHTVIVTNNYSKSPARTNLNVQARSVVSPLKHTHIFPTLRLDAVSDAGTALSPSLGINQALIPGKLHIRAQASHNFGVPTFNDLYWSTGGNPDLKPERSRKADIGLHYQQRNARSSLSIQSNIFYGFTRNGIIWQPEAGQTWMPVNLQKMRTKGTENTLSSEISLGAFQVLSSASYVFTRAFVPEPRFLGDAAVGKQIRYMPEHMLRAAIILSWKFVEISGEMAHNSERFTTEDHSSPLEPLQAHTIVNTSATLRLPNRIVTPEIKFTISNLTDTHFHSMAWYPMPGRQWLIGLILKR